MNKQILDSVVSLTESRDIDSLEVSLLSTIAEYIFCKVARIYELEKSWPNPEAQINIELTVQTDEPHFKWAMNKVVPKPPVALVTALDSERVTQMENSAGELELWIPVKGTRICLFIQVDQISDYDKGLIRAFSRIYSNYLKVLVESERDKLTGLLNRHSFERRLRQMLSKQADIQKQLQEEYANREAAENAHPWLVLIDIDHFKKVNDKFGHVCGDEVLLALAQKMKNHFRSTDYVFRFGGEEFVIIMESATLEAVNAKLDTFRQAISEDDFPLVGKLTISIGFTAADANDYEQLLMERADKALYYIKENGRNGVVSYEQLIADEKMAPVEKIESESDIDLF